MKYRKIAAPGPLLLLALALLAAGPADAGGVKPYDKKGLADLAGGDGSRFTAYPNPLGWQSEHPDSYPDPFLVVGTRPEGDAPKAGVTLHGARRSPADWVVSDGSGAVWVTGLPAPEAGKRVLFSGRFETADGKVATLKGIRFLVAGDASKTTVARPGDFVYYPLAGSKSSTVPVEIDGDAAAVAFTDERDALIVRALKPGTAKIRFFSLWFTEKTPSPNGEAILRVE